jgi:phage gp29-like protein
MTVEILDYLGNPVKLTSKPSKERLPQPGRLDRWGGHLMGSVNPARVARLLRAAEGGDLSGQAMLFDLILERDARLRGLMQSRANAVRGLEWQVEPASKKSPADKKVADFCKEALEGCRHFRTGLSRLNRAVGHGYAGIELFWTVKGGKNLIGQVQEVRQRFFYQDPETGEIRLRTDTTSWRGEAVPPYRMAIHRYDALTPAIGTAGLFRTLVWLWCFKHYNLKDFSVFCEIYGMPLRLGKYDQNASDDEKNALKAALQSLGSDGAGIISKDTEIEFVEAGTKGKGQYPHIEMQSLVNTEYAIAVLGQTLTTDAGDRGTQALGTVHDRVRLDLAEGDALGLEDTGQAEIIQPLVGFNFGWDADLPKFKLPVPRPKDRQSIAKSIETAARSGVKIGQNWARKELDIPEPEDGEDLVVPANTQAQEPFQLKGRTTTRRVNANIDEPAAPDELDTAIAPFLDRAFYAMEDFTYSVREMIEADHFQLAFLDIQALGESVQACLSRADQSGRTEAGEEMAAKLRRYANRPDAIFEFVPEAAAQFVRVKALTVATVTDVRLIEAIKNKLIESVESGKTRAWFAGRVNETFDELGVSRLRPWHLETVYQNNYLTAQSAGRFAALHANPDLDEMFPAFQYLTAGDDAVRAAHRAMHRRVYLRGDPIWLIWWPPNGHKCRCRVSPVSKYELEDLGISISRGAPIDLGTGRPFEPDPGWASNPAIDNRQFRDWMLRTISLDKTPEYYALPEWRDVVGLPAPGLLSGKKPEDFRQAFDDLFNVKGGTGAAVNFAGESVTVNDSLFDKLAGTDPARLPFLPMIKEVLSAPAEVWGLLHRERATEHYLAKFEGEADKTGFVAVQVENGQLTAVTFFPISKVREIDKRRKGVLTWLKG